MKSWKSLFVKTDEPEDEPAASPSPAPPPPTAYSFPVSPSPTPAAPPAPDPALAEVLRVYESGLDSINMPGYDFYEFYQAVSSTGQYASEGTYRMAFQMARTLDKSVTPAKLLQDAEFYISKINEVHGQYQAQGQQKLAALAETKRKDKAQLTQEIDQATQRMNALRAELQNLERESAHKREILAKVDESSYGEEKKVRDKMGANDMARSTSIDRLNLVKDGIQRFVK